MTGTFDPETEHPSPGADGNPYPAMNGDQRKGDNLYSDSVIVSTPATRQAKVARSVHPPGPVRLGRGADAAACQPHLTAGGSGSC
jgi:hypothetical protein